MATPISPCRVELAQLLGCVFCPLGGVLGRALFGGGPGGPGPSASSEAPAGGRLGRTGALTTLSDLLGAVPEVTDAVVVGLLENDRRLPSAVAFVIQPRGEVGGDALLCDTRSGRGTSLLIVGAKAGDAGNPGRGVRAWLAEEGRLLTPTSSILRALRGGGGVSGDPSGPVAV